ncbi:MAG TPA: hypothetical protein VEJ63_08070, partial [Planctomycetota bacterium]|nr:hypothetical protein [Planctomycetota bacterium]
MSPRRISSLVALLATLALGGSVSAACDTCDECVSVRHECWSDGGDGCPTCGDMYAHAGRDPQFVAYDERYEGAIRTRDLGNATFDAAVSSGIENRYYLQSDLPAGMTVRDWSGIHRSSGMDAPDVAAGNGPVYDRDTRLAGFEDRDFTQRRTIPAGHEERAFDDRRFDERGERLPDAVPPSAAGDFENSEAGRTFDGVSGRRLVRHGLNGFRGDTDFRGEAMDNDDRARATGGAGTDFTPDTSRDLDEFGNRTMTGAGTATDGSTGAVGGSSDSGRTFGTSGVSGGDAGTGSSGGTARANTTTAQGINYGGTGADIGRVPPAGGQTTVGTDAQGNAIFNNQGGTNQGRGTAIGTGGAAPDANQGSGSDFGPSTGSGTNNSGARNEPLRGRAGIDPSVDVGNTGTDVDGTGVGAGTTGNT